VPETIAGGAGIDVGEDNKMGKWRSRREVDRIERHS